MLNLVQNLIRHKKLSNQDKEYSNVLFEETNIDCEHHLGTVPLPCSSSLVSPRKKLIHLSGALIFVTETQGAPLDQLALVASGAYTCSPIGLYIFAHFKKLMPEGLALVIMNLNAEILPFGT